MVEDTEVTEDGRRPDRPAGRARGAVRRAGDDVHKGDLLFPTGTELRPAVVGVLASVGLVSVRVVSRPRVGVLSTGDELVEDGGPLGPGPDQGEQPDDAPRRRRSAGCTPFAIDEAIGQIEVGTRSLLADAAVRCDAVVTSGGVSMGDFDIVKAVLGRLATMRWMQIAIRPAKPFAFGLLSGPDRPVPVFGLPGNPVSSLVSFELLARPALRQMMGHRQLERPRVRAVADEGFRRRPDGKTHWNRVIGRFEDDGRLHVRSTGGQGSHQLASTAAANGLAAVQDGDGSRLVATSTSSS